MRKTANFKLALQRVILFKMAVIVLIALSMPMLVRAAQATNKSIQLSSSSVSATNVTYAVNFTSVDSAGAFVVDFCNNSPVIGQTCASPTGFNASSSVSATTGFTDVTGSANKIVVAGLIDVNDEVSVAINNITNPSVPGTMYARIVTYDTKEHATDYTSTNLGIGSVDEGGVAVAITPTIGVSGTVLESMTFCVSGSAISANCGSTTAPVLELGEEVGDIIALIPGVLSEGAIHTQISTNASGGATIHLKSNATDCGGLIRAGEPTACDILPALDGGLNKDANEGKFGVKTADATDTPSVGASGIFAPVSGSFYNKNTYAFNFLTGNITGVTSAFGDPFLDTAGAPANNKNMVLTFGVTVGSGTPAGSYSADIGLIAVGKF